MQHHPDCADTDMLAQQLCVGSTPDEAVATTEAPPTAPMVTAVDELDLLRYTALVERMRRLQAQYELQKVQTAETLRHASAVGVDLAKLLDTLGAKYNVDFHTHSIQPDGRIAPSE